MQDIVSNMSSGLELLLTLALVLSIVSIPFAVERLIARPHWQELYKVDIDTKNAVTAGAIGDNPLINKYMIGQWVRQKGKHNWQANLYMGLAVFGAAQIVLAIYYYLTRNSDTNWVVVGASIFVVMGSLHLFTLKKQSIKAAAAALEDLKGVLNIKGAVTIAKLRSVDNALLSKVQMGLEKK